MAESSHFSEKMGRQTAQPEAPPLPDVWQQAFENIQNMPVPASVHAKSWASFKFEAATFREGLAPQVAALGWSILDVFGVPPHPANLFAASAGLLMEAVRQDADVTLVTNKLVGLARRDGTGHGFVHRDSLSGDLVLPWVLARGRGG